jgi:DnaK suppressor protein
MTDEKIRQYQKRLHEMRNRLVGERQQLLEQVQKPVDNATGNDIATSSLRPDTVGVSEGDEEVAIGLYDNVEHTQVEVVAALHRIANGTFGLCENCGAKIAHVRLMAIPHARCCTGCVRRQANVSLG